MVIALVANWNCLIEAFVNIYKRERGWFGLLFIFKMELVVLQSILQHYG
jgi:hypothetical protein